MSAGIASEFTGSVSTGGVREFRNRLFHFISLLLGELPSHFSVNVATSVLVIYTATGATSRLRIFFFVYRNSLGC